jgi:hypothetical protein
LPWHGGQQEQDPRKFVKRERAVDDQPTSSLANLTWGEEFVNSYGRIRRELNIELATATRFSLTLIAAKCSL